MATKKTFTVNTHYLNLREEPSKRVKVLKILQAGETIEVDTGIETPEGWVAVNGGGFVMKEFLK